MSIRSRAASVTGETGSCATPPEVFATLPEPIEEFIAINPKTLIKLRNAAGDFFLDLAGSVFLAQFAGNQEMLYCQANQSSRVVKFARLNFLINQLFGFGIQCDIYISCSTFRPLLMATTITSCHYTLFPGRSRFK